MKFRKFISKTIIASLFMTNTILNTNASIWTEDERYETFKGNNISIHNILEEEKTEVLLEGNSLVNLANMGSSFEIRNLNDWYKDFTVCKTSKLKLNTDYTLFIYKEVLENHHNNYDSFQIGVSNILNATEAHPQVVNEHQNVYTFSFNSNKEKEVLKIKTRFTDFKNFKYLSVRPIRRNTAPVSNEYANANIKLLLLEGDYTGEDIEYFEGIQSVGQSDNNIEIKSSSKNLYPYGDIVSTWSNASSKSLIGWIKVKPNTTYTASRKENSDGLVHFIEYRNKDKIFTEHNVCFTKKDGQEIMLGGVNGDSITFTTGSKINYLYVTASSGATNTHEVLHSEIMLEEGNVKTEYEPYKEDILNITLKEPLKAIPNGKKDRIVKTNGRYYIERNCDEVIVNLNAGNYYLTYWSNGAYDTDTLYAFYVSSPNNFGTYENRIYNSYRIISDRWSNVGDVASDKEGVTAGLLAKPPYIGFKIEKDLIDSFEGESIQNKCLNYLKSVGDMKFILERINPRYELLNMDDISIQLFEGATNITNNSNIPASMEVTIDRVINKALEAIEVAKSNPTIDNISIARMWANLIEDSILKDEIQNNIGNITQVEDMEIERKTISSNIDLYVRSENALSMSLSTNNVIFDNYSSVSDLEKLNAVEITINSSLPYTLNASLESNIESLNGGSSLNPNVLNIRENSKTYQVFANTADKLILSDNIDGGNNNLHNIDLKLSKNTADKADVYKTTIRFEAIQK